MTWEMVPLGELAVNITRNGPLGNSETFTYVDLSSIDADRKAVASPTIVEVSAAPSRARQNLRSDDVLVSTVRPNLNGVAAVPDHLDGAVGSTGFCVLRPRLDALNARYLFHWVRTETFIGKMTQLATGASYPAVTDAMVRSSRIPLPPLPEQHRIAAILDEADALRSASREAAGQIAELEISIFNERFSTLRSAQLTVNDVLADIPNAFRTGPFGSDLLHGEFVNEGIPVLGIDNAVQNRFAWGKPRFITEAKYADLHRYTVRPGDVLITIMGTVGRCAVVPREIGTAINTKHLCCITLDHSRCLPEYLHGYFLHHPTARDYLRKTSKGAVMDGLNMSVIKQLPLVLPTIEAQQEYVRSLADIRTMRERLAARAEHLDSLFASLQHRAFRGEL